MLNFQHYSVKIHPVKLLSNVFFNVCVHLGGCGGVCGWVGGLMRMIIIIIIMIQY